MCCLGPHRDDLAFMSLNHDVALYGSRGQQRTVALALKLAEAEFLRQRTGEPPILLLDDVLSELDEHRRGFVLGSVTPDQQVLLTTTDLADFPSGFLANAAVYHVREASSTWFRRWGLPRVSARSRRRALSAERVTFGWPAACHQSRAFSGRSYGLMTSV